MKPKRYFSSFYHKDLSRFFYTYSGEKLPRNGPIGMLCGLTLEDRMLYPGKWVYYNSPADFVCCQYVFCIINLGIYRYFPDSHLEWCKRAKPFLDSTTCPTDHGAFNSEPYRIIEQTNSFITKFRHHFEAVGKRIIPLDKRGEFEVFPYEVISEEKLKEYVEFYFHEYLKKLNISENITDELIEKLKKDSAYNKTLNGG